MTFSNAREFGTRKSGGIEAKSGAGNSDLGGNRSMKSTYNLWSNPKQTETAV